MHGIFPSTRRCTALENTRQRLCDYTARTLAHHFQRIRFFGLARSERAVCSNVRTWRVDEHPGATWTRLGHARRAASTAAPVVREDELSWPVLRRRSATARPVAQLRAGCGAHPRVPGIFERALRVAKAVAIGDRRRGAPRRDRGGRGPVRHRGEPAAARMARAGKWRASLAHASFPIWCFLNNPA